VLHCSERLECCELNIAYLVRPARGKKEGEFQITTLLREPAVERVKKRRSGGASTKMSSKKELPVESIKKVV
jgi:hypothetical protein